MYCWSETCRCRQRAFKASGAACLNSISATIGNHHKDPVHLGLGTASDTSTAVKKQAAAASAFSTFKRGLAITTAVAQQESYCSRLDPNCHLDPDVTLT